MHAGERARARGRERARKSVRESTRGRDQQKMTEMRRPFLSVIQVLEVTFINKLKMYFEEKSGIDRKPCEYHVAVCNVSTF